MKVLHLIGGEDFGGAKSHVISLVNELKKEINVKIVTFRKGAFSSDADNLGIEIEVVKKNSFWRDIRRLRQIIQEENITLVHSHGAKANLFNMIIRMLTGVVAVSTVHSDYRLDYLDNRFKKYTFGLINALALRFVDYHVAVSQNFKHMLIKRGFRPEKIFTLYNGIQFDTARPAYDRKAYLEKFKLHIPENSIIVGILARFHPVKGLDVFLDAAGLIAKKHPQTIFLIGGEGDERKNLEAKAKKLGIHANTHFIGYVDDPYAFMDCLDINTLTSWSESFPYVILEGANQHRPVVSSNVGGISDLIVNGETGFLFEPGDYKQMAEHVNYLIENPSVRKHLGQNLYQIAKQKFSLESMGKTQHDIYKRVLVQFEKNKKTKRNYDIILSGYYGFENLGDDAMLQGILDSLLAIDKSLNILILSKNPLQTKLQFGISAINRLNIFSVLSCMMHSKLFIKGGGNLIQDNTSTRSLLYYLFTLWAAKKLGMKVMIYGNGIGPLNKELGRRLSAAVMKSLDVITLREEISYALLKELGVNHPHITITADPAFTLDTARLSFAKNILFEEGIVAHKKFVGFCIRKTENAHAVALEVARVADYIYETYDVIPLFIPMHYPYDVESAALVLSMMRHKGYVVKKKYALGDVLHLLSQLEFLIGMRLHSLIFAVKLGIPILGISYEPKVDGFLALTAQSSEINTQNIQFKSLKTKIDTLWTQRDAIKKEMKDLNQHILMKANEDAHIALKLLKDAGDA